MSEPRLSQAETNLLKKACGQPDETLLQASRQNVQDWFSQTTPLIQWDVIDSPIGALTLASSANGLCAIHFGDDAEAYLRTLDKHARFEHNAEPVAEVTQQLREYFAGERKVFDLKLDERYLTAFQRDVFGVVNNIPAGEFLSYGQVAQALERPKASRAVGRALGANPIPIIIPCHRVLGHDKSLTGYAGGVDKKLLLLRLEQAI